MKERTFNTQRFTMKKKDAIKIQADQLNEWKEVLSARAFELLKKWATKMNKETPEKDGNLIRRGEDLANFIANLAIQMRRETVKSQR
jgi:hypothetical protein